MTSEPTQMGNHAIEPTEAVFAWQLEDTAPAVEDYESAVPTEVFTTHESRSWPETFKLIARYGTMVVGAALIVLAVVSSHLPNHALRVIHGIMVGPAHQVVGDAPSVPGEVPQPPPTTTVYATFNADTVAKYLQLLNERGLYATKPITWAQAETACRDIAEGRLQDDIDKTAREGHLPPEGAMESVDSAVLAFCPQYAQPLP